MNVDRGQWRGTFIVLGAVGVLYALPYFLFLVEYLTGSPFIDEITAGGWQLDADGMLAIPEKPSLGLTLHRDAVQRNTREDFGIDRS